MKAIEPFDGSLSLEDILNGMNLCLENAEQLLNDAQLLIYNKSYGHAFALTTLAVEEMGKCLMLATAAKLEKSDEESWKKFWRRFRHHKAKQANVVMLDYLLLENVTAEETLWEIEKVPFDRLKQLGLYVDNIDGSFVSPAVFPKKFAVIEISLARNRLRVMKRIQKHMKVRHLRKMREIVKDKKKITFSRAINEYRMFLEKDGKKTNKNL